MLKLTIYPSLGAHFGLFLVQQVQDTETNTEDELLTYAQLEQIEQCGSEN